MNYTTFYLVPKESDVDSAVIFSDRNDTEFIIDHVVPGYTSEDLSVEVAEGSQTLTVKGKRREGVPQDGYAQGFINRYKLQNEGKEPLPFNDQTIVSTFINGILRVVITIPEKYQSKKLSIK